jgi:hypothetical protein
MNSINKFLYKISTILLLIKKASNITTFAYYLISLVSHHDVKVLFTYGQGMCVLKFFLLHHTKNEIFRLIELLIPYASITDYTETKFYIDQFNPSVTECREHKVKQFLSTKIRSFN